MRPDELSRIAHDPAIFEAFYREHVGAVQRFVVRRVADPHRAADLTAQVFVAAIDAANAIPSGASSTAIRALVTLGQRRAHEIPTGGGDPVSHVPSSPVTDRLRRARRPHPRRRVSRCPARPPSPPPAGLSPPGISRYRS
jgi:hypothetical protein